MEEAALDDPGAPAPTRTGWENETVPSPCPIEPTERLVLRNLAGSDRAALGEILQDPDTMTAYEGAFSDAQVDEWMAKQVDNYDTHGHGLWAVTLAGRLIGQCGITWQAVHDEPVLEVGYLFNRRYWHHGYATEAARACLDWAFTELRPPRVYAIIRDTNTASMNVAIRLGMTVRTRFVKHYRCIDMPHVAYAVDATPTTSARGLRSTDDDPVAGACGHQPQRHHHRGVPV